MKKSSKRSAAAAKPSKAPAHRSSAPSGADFPIRRVLVYIALVALLLLVCFVRLRLLSLPLERDEGEYALAGQLILKGIPPYEMVYNMKLPGTYYLYALLMLVFGQTTVGIHAGLLVVHMVSLLLLFAVGKKMANDAVGVLAAAAYGLMCLVPGSLGLAAHATHFIVLCGLAGLWLLLRYFERPGWGLLIASGVAFGLAFLMKQQAVFLLAFAGLALALHQWEQTPRSLKQTMIRMGVLGGALVLPYLVVVLVAVLTGSFDRFWHWTVEYASQYASVKTFDRAMLNLKPSFQVLSAGVVPFWYAGIIGLAALFFSPAARRYRWHILLFALFSACCVLPGFYFRNHYFIVFFPALALLVALAVYALYELAQKHVGAWAGFLPFAAFAGLFYLGLNRHASALFQESPEIVSLRMYGRGNPFQESVEIARYIRANTEETDKIAVVGSEPQIYFYSNRLPATGYIYTYPLMEEQPYSREMQREMIAEIEQNQPKFLVYVNVPFSWLRKEQSHGDIFNWYNGYKNQYKLVGLVDMLPLPQRSEYRWDGAVAGYVPQGQGQISVYRRE